MSNINATAPSSLISQLEAAQATQGLTDQQLCGALGFEREIVLSLIKAGSMKMPLTKIPALATALKLDAAELMRAALSESDPELSKAIEEVFDPMRLTATEVTLIKHLRELSGNAPGAPIVFEDKPVTALVAVSA